jgi:hypothetical protein
VTQSSNTNPCPLGISLGSPALDCTTHADDERFDILLVWHENWVYSALILGGPQKGRETLLLASEPTCMSAAAYNLGSDAKIAGHSQISGLQPLPRDIAFHRDHIDP